MCGIAGILLSQGDSIGDAQASVGEMANAVYHRGPDSGGVWSDSARLVALGHRRLSIIDLTDAASQPMVDEETETAVVFNGEIYNYQELRAELEAQGVVFRTRSDTEVLLKGYLTWQYKVLDRLVGMFAFAIWDGRRRELFLARDRAGEKPLYYAELPTGGFAFASELAALKGRSDIDKTIDPDAISLYLQYLYVPAPYSIYQGVKKLPAAHYAVVKPGGQFQCQQYWDPKSYAMMDRISTDGEDPVDQLDALLRKSIKGQMIADVPLGAFLSGGFDSSIIASYLVELSSTKPKTYTIGFEEERCNEAPYAEAVAKYLGTEHVTEYVSEKDVLDVIPQMPAMYGEPFADPSALPTYLVCKMARRHVTVCLTGDGGDELFGGYRIYPLIPRIAWAGWMPRVDYSWSGPLVQRLPESVRRPLKYFGRNAEQQYLELRRHTSLWESQRLFGRSAQLSKASDVYALQDSLSRNELAMLADFVTYFPGDILAKVDRAAMAVSLETRTPILDHRLVEFAFRLPAELRIDRTLWKQLAYRRIPRNLLDRPKAGFNIPLAEWLRGELKELATEMLVPKFLEPLGIQDCNRVQYYLDEHMAGRGTHSFRLWTLIVLAMWFDAQ